MNWLQSGQSQCPDCIKCLMAEQMILTVSQQVHFLSGSYFWGWGGGNMTYTYTTAVPAAAYSMTNQTWSGMDAIEQTNNQKQMLNKPWLI